MHSGIRMWLRSYFSLMIINNFLRVSKRNGCTNFSSIFLRPFLAFFNPKGYFNWHKIMIRRRLKVRKGITTLGLQEFIRLPGPYELFWPKRLGDPPL